MPTRIRRLLPLVIGLALILPAAAPATAASEGASAIEAKMLSLVNAERTKRGLVALRLDNRLATLARDRSEYQAARDIGSHTHAGGTTVFDMIEAANIRWFAAGEIIAQNRYYPTLLDSAKAAVRGWLGSDSHRAILLSKGYNYVGFGYAMNEGSLRRYWTGVFMRGPDRTDPYADITSAGKAKVSRGVRVTLRWAGADRRLQVLTSGLRYFEVQRRRPGGTWKSFGTTTKTVKRVTYARNRTIEFRVRARDKAGNWSRWDTFTVKT
jgi:uncharacterized protein YkwD